MKFSLSAKPGEILQKIKTSYEDYRARRRQRKLDMALVHAARYGTLAKVEKLIAAGARAQGEDGEGNNALGNAVRRGDADVAMVSALLAAGGDPDSHIKSSYHSALVESIVSGKPAIFAALLQAGADTGKADAYGASPLHAALNAGRHDMAGQLVDAGADVNAAGYRGRSPLFLAVRSNRPKMVEKLLAAGADVAQRDHYGYTPVDYARHRRCLDVLPALLAAQDQRVAPWQKLGDQEIASVSINRALGYRITEIFNFETSQYKAISRNLETGQEAIAVRGFAEMTDKALVEKAAARLKGG